MNVVGGGGGNSDSLLFTSCTELMTAWSTANRNFKVRVDDDKVWSLTQGLTNKNTLVRSMKILGF
jgi:hypothetical protein